MNQKTQPNLWFHKAVNYIVENTPTNIHTCIIQITNSQAHFQAPNGVKAVERRRFFFFFFCFLPARKSCKWDGIPIPWSLRLIHNRPTAGLLWTSADMPTRAHQ